LRLKPQASSLKPQATSLKPQASSLKPQASSLKPQASSFKPQASSLKPQALSSSHVIIRTTVEATIYRFHRFFPIDQSMGKFYGKPIFFHRFGILWDFSSYPIEFLSVFPKDW
jgi:hypothetical protein